MSLTVTIEKRDDREYVVKPHGRMDTETSPSFEEKVNPLLSRKPKVMIIDMAELDYISSAGVRSIFKAWKGVESAKGSFLMLHLQPQIQTVFDIVKALPAEQVFTSVEEVDAYLDKMQRKTLEKD